MSSPHPLIPTWFTFMSWVSHSSVLWKTLLLAEDAILMLSNTSLMVERFQLPCSQCSDAIKKWEVSARLTTNTMVKLPDCRIAYKLRLVHVVSLMHMRMSMQVFRRNLYQQLCYKCEHCRWIELKMSLFYITKLWLKGSGIG